MFVTNLRKLFTNFVTTVLTTLLCTLLFVSAAYPAYANVGSRPDEGEANLNKIQAKTEKLATEDPPSLKDVQRKQGGGLNEVQGTADKDKMINPGNAKGVSFEERVKDFLGNDKDSK